MNIRPVRQWVVTAVFRQGDGMIVTENRQLFADSFWEAIGRIVDDAPPQASELINIHCMKV